MDVSLRFGENFFVLLVVNYDSIFFTAYACRIYLHLRVENSSLASVSTLRVEEKLDSARKQ